MGLRASSHVLRKIVVFYAARLEKETLGVFLLFKAPTKEGFCNCLELLLKHIREHQNGSRLQDLMQVLPMLTRPQVQKLLNELKSQNAAYNMGATRGSLWYSGSIAPKIG
jgi:hypothetical protein